LFNIKITVFLPVNAQLGWLDNVDGIPKAHSSLLLIGQQVWNISLAPALASHLVEDFVDEDRLWYRE
jgi:hypothetical protein